MAVARTRVTFRPIDEELLDWYVGDRGVAWTLGRLRDPGRAVRLARKIDGEVENVVGLPVAALRDIYPELFDA